MTRLIRWLLAITVGVSAVLVVPTGAAAEAIGGVELRYLPPGLGTSTDFEYEYDDVSFVARVWESGSDEAGWRVDLDVDVMHGDRLTDARALHDWFVAYEERPPAEARYRRTVVLGHPGWIGTDEAFWLVRPGEAVAIRLDRTRWPFRDLVRTAWGVRAP